MNKKGSVLIYGSMLALIIIILALALAPAVSEATTDARNDTRGDSLGMNCTNPLIDNFTHAACIASDLSLFYFIGAILLIGGGIWVTKLIFQ